MAWVWLTAKTMDLPILPAGSRWACLRKGLAHDAVAGGRENLPFKVLNLEVLFLLVDDDRPAGFGQGLGGDVGAEVEDLRQAEERAFGVFDGVDDVVAEGREAGLAAEVVVGVAELAGFEGLGVLGCRAARRSTFFR